MGNGEGVPSPIFKTKINVMYNFGIPTKTSIELNQSYEGERIEEKVDRILNNGEPISDGAPIIYTERKDGVLPEYDIRTDRFEIAVEAMDKITKSAYAKREARIVEMQKKKDIDGKSIQGTENQEGSSL